MARDRVRIYQGDSLDVIRDIDTRHVAAVLCDPPYGMSWDTDSTRYTGSQRQGGGINDWPEVLNDDVPFDPSPWLDYPKVILWGSNHFAQRLPVGSTLVWIKRTPQNYGVFLSDAEVAWQKGGHGVYCYTQIYSTTKRAQEGGGDVLHPNQKPVDLMRWCLKRLNLKEGDTVLDPYMGSGTVGVACLRMGYDYIGIEMNPPYFQVARKRLDLVQNKSAVEVSKSGVQRRRIIGGFGDDE